MSRSLALKLALLASAGCAHPAATPHRRTPPPELQGVAIALSPPVDARDGILVGCGQSVPDLGGRTGDLLRESLREAGARLDDSSGWRLSVRVTQAGAQAQDFGDRGRGPPASADRGVSREVDVFAQGYWSGVRASLLGELRRSGKLVWAGTVTGRSNGARCVEVAQQVRAALADAADALRERVASQVGAAKDR